MRNDNGIFIPYIAILLTLIEEANNHILIIIWPIVIDLRLDHGSFFNFIAMYTSIMKDNKMLMITNGCLVAFFVN